MARSIQICDTGKFTDHLSERHVVMGNEERLPIGFPQK